MKKTWGILAGIVVLSCLAVPARADKWTDVDARELKAMMDAGDVIVVNPLSRIEFNDLAIKGSINIPLGELARKMPKDKGAKIVFYCLGIK